MTLLAAALLLLPMPRSLGPGKANQSFGVNAVSIKGFRTGEAFLTGCGAYNPNSETACLRVGGEFRCLADIEQIPLTGRRKKMVDLLPFLTSVIGLRDPYGEGHSKHVRELSTTFGRKIDLTSAQIETLAFAAEIHDIGKIAINEFIINKPGRFTEAEYLMIQHHAALGAKLIETLSVDSRIPLTILHHHENFDGSGYPYKLTGDQIPLESRIIRIIDTYDALTSNRGYRPAYTHKRALAIMELDQDFFDPQLLEIFFQMQHHRKP